MKSFSSLSQRSLLALGVLSISSTAFAQFPMPKFPGMPTPGSNPNKDDARNRKRQQRRDANNQGGTQAPGVPVSPDNPMFNAFRLLQQQPSYRTKMTMSTGDPQMAQMMEQMGFRPFETIQAGEVKQVSAQFRMPVMGATEDFELRSVFSNGRGARKWISPASKRIVAAQDAQLAKSLAELEAQTSKDMAEKALSGPMGWLSAGVEAASAAASTAMIFKARKTVHDFWEWQCSDAPAGVAAAAASRNEPPPLTDLRVVGDQNLDGVPVTTYEFYVTERGRSQGPVQMHITKDTGLPMRMNMNFPQMNGSMQMDYADIGKATDIEIPDCLKAGK